MKLKVRYTFFSLISCYLISSCDFNVNDGPGEKWSGSIKESKLHGTFLCAYKVRDNKINSDSIFEIFAEHKYLRKDDGFLQKKEIDCCQSQLIIVSSGPEFSTDSSGYGINWKIIGFNNPSPYASLIYRDYKGTIFPDSIPITVVAIKGKDSNQVIQKLTLYKINEK